jgi:hypothetical protein
MFTFTKRFISIDSTAKIVGRDEAEATKRLLRLIFPHDVGNACPSMYRREMSPANELGDSVEYR